MTEPLPAPLTPADCDLRHFGFMPLDVQRLLTSEWWINALEEEPEACGPAVNLWATSWHQVPAASLPDSDAVLRRIAGVDRSTWETVRKRVMAPWVKCSDGRIYHPVVAQKALEATEKNRRQSEGGKEGNRRRWGSGSDRSPITKRSDSDRTEQDPIKTDDNRSSVHRNDREDREDRHDREQPRARGLDPEVQAIIAEFDAARVAAHGAHRARLSPHATDTVIASRWVAQGLTAAILSPLFYARHRAKAQAGQEPIDCLRFLERAVAELGGSPTPSQPAAPGNVHTHPAAELEQRKAAHIAALKIHLASPDTVPKPPASAYGLAYNRETQQVMLAPGPRPPIPAPQDASAEGAA